MIFLERGSKIRVRADVRQNFGLKCALTWWQPLGISQVLRDSRVFKVCFETTTVVSCFGHHPEYPGIIQNPRWRTFQNPTFTRTGTLKYVKHKYLIIFDYSEYTSVQINKKTGSFRLPCQQCNDTIGTPAHMPTEEITAGTPKHACYSLIFSTCPNQVRPSTCQASFGLMNAAFISTKRFKPACQAL